MGSVKIVLCGTDIKVMTGNGYWEQRYRYEIILWEEKELLET